MKEKCCEVNNNDFELEAVISFDERGQLILPKDVRAKFGLEAGEKFALVSCSDKGQLCCFHIIKTNKLSETIGQMVQLNKMK
jgi:antitoxin PrlF